VFSTIVSKPVTAKVIVTARTEGAHRKWLASTTTGSKSARQRGGDVTSTETRPSGRVFAWAGLLLYIGTGVFPYLASGLVAPLWGIVVLYVGWLAGLWLTVSLLRRRSGWALAMPVAALAFWLLVITLGESVFGWTA
jgi:hypothetical protein